MKKVTRVSAKKLISLSLYKLILKKDYESITVKEICKEAGISRMSFYRKYDKKDDIFIDYCDERFAEFYEGYLQKQQNLPLKDFLVNIFEFIYRYRRQLLILKKANRQQLLENQFLNYAKFIISRINTPELKRLKDNPAATPFLSGGVLNLLFYWLENAIDKSPNQIANYLFDLFDNKD